MLQRMQENPNLKPPMIKFGKKVEEVLKRRPSKGPLFPYLSTIRASDRATEFKQRCTGLGIKGISLTPTATAGPNAHARPIIPCVAPRRRWARDWRLVHRAYAKNAAVTTPTLDEWQELVANKIIDISKIPNVA